MNSRMDKYYEQDLSDLKRTKKNKKLYEDIYGIEDDFEELPISSNVKELDASSLKREITSREEYQKMKDFGDITNSKIVKNEEKVEEEINNNKVYDINKLLEKAKNDNHRIRNNDYEVNDKYLKSLEKFTEEESENKDNYKDADELYKKQVQDQMHETASLSLEILSDLKPDNNTIVSAPIKEEVIKEADLTEEEQKQLEEEKEFYSNKYAFNKEDFDDEFSDIDSSNDTVKVMLIIFGVIVCIALTILALKYFCVF